MFVACMGVYMCVGCTSMKREDTDVFLCVLIWVGWLARAACRDPLVPSPQPLGHMITVDVLLNMHSWPEVSHIRDEMHTPF